MISGEAGNDSFTHDGTTHSVDHNMPSSTVLNHAMDSNDSNHNMAPTTTTITTVSNENVPLHSYIFYCCDYFLHLVVSCFILFWVSYYVFLFVHFYPYANNWFELMGLCHQTSVYHINALCNEVVYAMCIKSCIF